MPTHQRVVNKKFTEEFKQKQQQRNECLQRIQEMNQIAFWTIKQKSVDHIDIADQRI